MDAAMTQKILGMIKGELANPSDALMKAFTQSASAVSGITAYSLEAPAKSLIPVITPLRNKIPRSVGGQGIQANWRAFLALNTTGMSIGVSEGKRSGVVTTVTGDYYAKFAFMGLDDYVTEQAFRAAVGFQDLRAAARLNLLRAVMIGEEKVVLGGNGTAVTLSKPTTPTVTNVVSTAGTMAPSQKYTVCVVALTLEGYLNSSIAGGVPLTVSRTDAGPYTGTTTYGGGNSVTSDPGSQTTTADGLSTHVLACSTPVVPGAVAYAWYWNTDANGAGYLLGAITTINSVIITTPAGAGTQKSTDVGATDCSKNALIFDGLLYQAWKSNIAGTSNVPGIGSYVYNMPTGTAGTGTPLTADGKGGIVEFDVVLRYMWDNFRLSPETVYVSAQEAQNITQKILTGAVSASQSFSFHMIADQSKLVGGMVVDAYLNKFGMDGAQRLKIQIHPNMPPGTVLFDTDILPYPLSNVANVKEMELRFDYMAVDWPKVRWADEFGVYFDGVLKHYAPFAMAIINNIANG
jgi:hypothetical protein